MSIAVRISVWILGVLVVVSAAVAVLALVQNQTLQGQKTNLQNQINSSQLQLVDLASKTKKLQDDADQLNNKVSQTQQEKSQIQSQYDLLKKKSDDLQSQLEQSNSDRDDWKNRVQTIKQERDELMQKLRNRPPVLYKDRIVYKNRIIRIPAAPAVPTASAASPASASAPAVVDVTSGQGDQYWASVLRQKAALQVDLEKEKSDLDQAALQVVDLKKKNSDLELQIKQVTNEKDEIIQKIKYGQDLADNLSIDLARSRNDQKAVNDRAEKLKVENLQLLSQIKDLTSSKLELEKTISQLTDDKDSMQKKLIETESVIQSRIDDIWKIKESLDKKLSQNTTDSSSTGSMELPPIIVNAPNNQQAPTTVQPSSQAVATGKTEGSIISINQTNNFVIVDLGQENSSISVGRGLKVYRQSNVIASLEVIQVRRDICAADIKNKSSELKVGDVVKFN